MEAVPGGGDDLPSSDTGGEKVHYQSHFLQGDEAILLRLLENPEGGIPFRNWSSANVLCKWLEQEHVDGRLRLNGRKVLELGSGCGLVGILCAHLGADVTLTDTADVIPHTLRNTDRNTPGQAHGGSMRVQELLWGTDVMATFGREGFDLIIGSDLTYYEHLFEPLALTLLQLAGADTDLILAHSCRWGAERETWRFRFQRYFEIEDVALEVPTGSDLPEDVFEIQKQTELSSDAKETHFCTRIVRLRLLAKPRSNQEILQLLADHEESVLPPPLPVAQRSLRSREEILVLADEDLPEHMQELESSAHSSKRPSCCVQ